MTLLESGKICYVVSTSAKGRDPSSESVRLRRLAVEHDIDCLTAIDTANALADSLSGKFTDLNTTLVDINKLLHQFCFFVLANMFCGQVLQFLPDRKLATLANLKKKAFSIIIRGEIIS